MGANNQSSVAGVLLLVAGGIIGAGLALLYAPQSGSKTRKQISRYAGRVRNEAEENLRDTADAVTEMIDSLSEKTTEIVERGGEIAEDWRRYLLESLERGQKGLEKQRKKVSNL